MQMGSSLKLHNERKMSKTAIFVLLGYLFTLLFFSGNGATTNNGVVIPFVRFSATYLLLFVLMVGTLFVVYQWKAEPDAISILLFVRLILCVLPLSYLGDTSNFLGKFIEASFPFFIYTIFSNCDIDVKRLSRIFMAFGVVVALQCLLAFLMIRVKGYANYGDLFYKNYFVIPVGATNNISAVLLPLLILGDKTIQNSLKRIAYVALLFVAIFLCKSRTGLLICVAYYVYRLLQWVLKGKYQVFVVCAPIMAVALLVFISGTPLWAKIQSLLLGYSSSGGGLNALTSGRLSLYGRVFVQSMRYPWLGNGLNYRPLRYIGTHNIFLQFLYENGIVGVCFLCVLLFFIIERIVRANKKNKYDNAFATAMVFVFVNGLVEDVLLSHFMILFVLTYLSSMKNQGKKNVGGKKDV